MWDRWLSSYPELDLLELDIGVGRSESRALHGLAWGVPYFMPPDERTLLRCLRLLADDNYAEAAAIADEYARGGCLLPDLPLLAGALHLHYGRISPAVAVLEHSFLARAEPGLAIRRLYPGLRLLLRISPCVLLPLYPNAFAAHALFATALLLEGQVGAALDVVREMSARWGLHDEAKLLAGVIHLARDEPEQAIAALASPEDTQHDSLELARGLHLALAHYRLGEYRNAARVLVPMLLTIKQANMHLQARARLLLAECYERNGMVFAALKESAQVVAAALPGDIAGEVLAREERWVVELASLGNHELEQLARADTYQIYMPDEPRDTKRYSALDVSRDPLKKLVPKAASWRQRQEEKRQFDRIRAAYARGDTVELDNRKELSPQARELKAKVAAAQGWWPSRRDVLEQARSRARERLAIADPRTTGHLRFDWAGQRAAPAHRLTGEQRFAMLSVVTTSVLLIALALWIIRSCVYMQP